MILEGPALGPFLRSAGAAQSTSDSTDNMAFVCIQFLLLGNCEILGTYGSGFFSLGS